MYDLTDVVQSPSTFSYIVDVVNGNDSQIDDVITSSANYNNKYAGNSSSIDDMKTNITNITDILNLIPENNKMTHENEKYSFSQNHSVNH